MLRPPATVEAHRGKRAKMGLTVGAIIVGLGIINLISVHTPYLAEAQAPTVIMELGGIAIYSSFVISGLAIGLGGFVAASSEAMRRQEYTLQEQAVEKSYKSPFTFLSGSSFDYADIETIVIQTFTETATITLKGESNGFFGLGPEKFSMNAITEYKDVVAFLEDQISDPDYKLRVGNGRGTQIIDIEEPPWDMDDEPELQ